MQILFQDNQPIAINLNQSSLSVTIQNIFKHLQHVPLPWRAWDNPFYILQFAHSELIDVLAHHATLIGIKVDKQRCIDYDQLYYNHLHEIYEKNYDGNPLWLNFHEHIHLCECFENHRKRAKVLQIDYREKAGLLERPFNQEWLDNTTVADTGMVYVQWAELGKTPYDYWNNNEPKDINRMCELAKPWLKLRPKLHVALEPKDCLEHKNISGFNLWWQEFESAWCDHWNLPSWSLQNMYSISCIGQVADVDRLKILLQQNVPVTGIKLQ